jgi:mRNA interferase MazF
MILEGQVILFKFPQTDQKEGKLRPALILRKLPGNLNDYLICMISSQIHAQIPEFDEIIVPEDLDFSMSGLKQASVIRISRLAVVNESVFLGKIGQIDNERLNKIRHNLALWING